MYWLGKICPKKGEGAPTTDFRYSESTSLTSLNIYAHLLSPKLHNTLLVAGSLRGLDAAAVELGVEVVTPFLQHVDVDIGHGQEHAHNRIPDVHPVTRVGLGAYLIEFLVKILKTVPFRPGILQKNRMYTK